MPPHPSLPRPPQSPPVTEVELHAWLDGQLPPDRASVVRDYLASRPDERLRLEGYRAQKRALHALFDPILDEPLPQPLLQAAWPRTPWMGWRLVAGVCALGIALASGLAGWGLRGWVGHADMDGLFSTVPAGTANDAVALGFVQRAAVAHAVYSPDQRRAVELDAAHEAQLVTWLTRRLGTQVRVPHLQAQGFELEGGRLLPGGGGPVAQFMYRQAGGERLTLYVSNELADLGSRPNALASPPVVGPVVQDTPRGTPGRAIPTAFRFAKLGAVNVFYWADGGFGYALSADLERSELAEIAVSVYQQLALPVLPAKPASADSSPLH